MIVENGKYYLYRHIRCDKNEVFYVGIGTKSNRNYKTFKSIYYRAHKITNRNVIWHNIVKKTDYIVEIILESDDYSFIKEKEIEFIKLYGKKTYHGTLINLTDGGDGTIGYIKPKSKDSKFSKKIYQYSLSGEFIKMWECGYDIERELNFKPNSIYNCCNKPNIHKTAYNFQWRYVYETSLKNIIKPVKIKRDWGILLYDLKGSLIREFNSIKEAAIYYNIRSSTIVNNLNGLSKKTKIGIWKRKENNRI